MSQMGSGFESDHSRKEQQQAATMDASWTDVASGERNAPPPRAMAEARRPQGGVWAGLRSRLAGPGGQYNAGNALGLIGGAALAVAAAAGETGATIGGGAAAVAAYLAGSASALCVTLAMLVFFWSGEAYHRAWARGHPPDARLNRLGDMTSGYGALALGAGLFLMGEPLLAATAAPGGPGVTAVAAPGLLLICYLIWARADLMLFRSDA